MEPHADGWLVAVRAVAGARRNEVRGEQAGELKVCVTQIAERGKANTAIRDALAKWLGVRKSQVELVAGTSSPHKKFLVRGITAERLQGLLDSAERQDG
jgi:uncharacterized protein YggU (UPF0235/DUF167 family)